MFIEVAKPLKDKNILFGHFVINVNWCMLDLIIETGGRAGGEEVVGGDAHFTSYVQSTSSGTSRTQ